MNDKITDIFAEKFGNPEKLVLLGMNDLVNNALKEAKDIDAKKIAIVDINERTRNFFVIPAWKLLLLNPNISFKQVYSENKEIFEKVKEASKDSITSIYNIIGIIESLYKFPGLIILEGEQITGFVSLANFSKSELEEIDFFKKSFWIREERVKMKGVLAGVRLHESYLVKVDLMGADIRGADLSKANLSRANLRSANLTGANLSGANLTDAKLVRAKLDGANLKDAILMNADLRNAELWNADLENAQLQGANLTDSVLYRANLKSANLENANLYNAGLMSANLEGTDLSNADIRNANFKYAIFDEKTKLNGIEINSITIDNLTESALKADWNPEIKQILEKKWVR